MPRKAEYKILAGTEKMVMSELSKLNSNAQAHWEPKLMTTIPAGRTFTIFLLVEHVLGT